MHFLNSILRPQSPITSVSINNPYNERNYVSAKLSVVDIKAKDTKGVVYQIEIQLSSPWYIPFRMLYTWGSIYQKQIKKSSQYKDLKPVISIWLLTENIFDIPDENDEVWAQLPDEIKHWHHHFQLWDLHHRRLLTDHCSIHVIEINKWTKPETLQPEDIWLYFLKEAKSWKTLPAIADIPVMRVVMNILEAFSEREHQYLIYEARLDAMREQLTIESDLEEARDKIAKAQARAEKEQIRADKAQTKAEEERKLKQSAQTKAEEAQTRAEKAELEQERLRELLSQANIDPQT